MAKVIICFSQMIVVDFEKMYYHYQ